MATEFKYHPALKHGIYSPTAVLPNENPAEFKKLHRSLVAELRVCPETSGGITKFSEHEED